MARLVVLALFALAACTPSLPSTPPATGHAPEVDVPVHSVLPTPAPSPGPSPELGGGAITSRYPDGLPMWMGGSFVHRGTEAIDFARGRMDASAFLVTGWATYFGPPVSCPLFMDGSSWERDCRRVRLSDVAGIADEMTEAVTFRDLLAAPSPFPPLLGPVVVAAHARDLRAGECVPDPTVCAAMMVVERVVWSGDSATDPAPISGDAVAAALLEAQDTMAAPFGPGSQISLCRLPGLAVYALTVPDDVAPRVTCANVAPSTEAIRRAVDQAPGVVATLRPKAVVMESRSWLRGDLTAHVTYRWLVVENVALMVRTHAKPTAGDRAFLEQLVDLLSPPA